MSQIQRKTQFDPLMGTKANYQPTQGSPYRPGGGGAPFVGPGFQGSRKPAAPGPNYGSGAYTGSPSFPRPDLSGTPAEGFGNFRDLLFGEIATQQGLANQQYERLGGISNDFRSAIAGGIEGARGVATQEADALRRVGENDLSLIQGRVAMQEKALENTTAQSVQAQTIGAERGVQNQINQIKADPSLPAEVKEQRISELKRSSGEMLTQTLSNAGVAFSQQQAQLMLSGTSQIADAAARRGQMASLAAQTRLAGEQAVQQYTAMFPSLGQMVASNPPPFVSTFAGLMSLANMAMTMGSSQEGAAAFNLAGGMVSKDNFKPSYLAGDANKDGTISRPESGFKGGLVVPGAGRVASIGR